MRSLRWSSSSRLQAKSHKKRRINGKKLASAEGRFGYIFIFELAVCENWKSTVFLWEMLLIFVRMKAVIGTVQRFLGLQFS